MNRTKILAISLVFLYFAVALTTNVAVADEGHDTDQCTTPTEFIAVEARSDLSFNVSTISLPKDTCVKITFVNADTSAFHDLVVDAVSGWEGFEIVAEAGETHSLLVMTPNADIDTKFYCSVPGHREAGMEGTFKVGDSGDANASGTPGFGFVPAIFAMLALLAIPVIRRK